MELFLVKNKKNGHIYLIFDRFIKNDEVYYMIVNKSGIMRHIEAKVMTTYYWFVDKTDKISDFIDFNAKEEEDDDE